MGVGQVWGWWGSKSKKLKPNMQTDFALYTLGGRYRVSDQKVLGPSRGRMSRNSSQVAKLVLGALRASANMPKWRNQRDRVSEEESGIGGLRIARCDELSE